MILTGRVNLLGCGVKDGELGRTNHSNKDVGINLAVFFMIFSIQRVVKHTYQ